MKNTTTHFIDTEFGKMYYFKSLGYTEKIESSKYSYPTSATNKMRNEILAYHKKQFEDQILHQIRVKNNPNYREQYSRISYETKGKYPKFN